MRSTTPAAPGSEPLTRLEAKTHLGIADAFTTHDAHVDDLITAAREQWEHDTQSLTVSRSVVENLDNWPDDCWRFYYRPIITVDSVKYYDEANSQQTLASSVYSLDAPNRKLRLDVDQEWPSIEARWDAVEVTYTAGYSTVPEIAKSAMKLQIDILFELRGEVKEKDAYIRAYNALVERFGRADYP